MSDVEITDEQEAVHQPYSHTTLLLLKSAQSQNGLRHNDYGRYHHYCVRKMHRLRKALGYQQ